MADQLRLTEATVQGAAAQLGLDRVTIYRLVRRYRQRPQTSSLLPRKRGRDRNSRFLEQSREDLIAACIKEFYLVPEQPSIAALLQEVRRRFAERRLPTPNYRTVVRRVVALDPRFVMTKRQGTKAAREKYGPVGVPNLRSDVPLEILQIDLWPGKVFTVPKCILIVDDSPVLRKTLRQTLEQEGAWEVCGEAADGREAIEKAQQLKPDLVVLDHSTSQCR